MAAFTFAAAAGYAPQPPAPRSRHTVPSRSRTISFGPGRAHGQTAGRSALKTQELGRATVCTRERASLWECARTLEHQPLPVGA